MALFAPTVVFSVHIRSELFFVIAFYEAFGIIDTQEQLTN
jgi:hypothetical protein